MLRRSGQKDVSTHSHAVWLQVVLREEARMGGDRSGRSLRTSFNSTLLWKLQLPLSRLVPLLHPYAAAASTTQTTPTDLQSGRDHHPKPVVCVGELVCVCVCVSVCLICQTINMHKKSTLKHLVKTKTYERPDFNILLTLHNQG